jgi:hypothetical protein
MPRHCGNETIESESVDDALPQPRRIIMRRARSAGKRGQDGAFNLVEVIGVHECAE